MADESTALPLLGPSPPSTSWAARCAGWRRRSLRYLESKEKHYLILALVGVDVVAILAEILVTLVACETGAEKASWVHAVLDATKLTGLVISSLFMVELLSTIWAFGWSFVVDVLAHGILEEIASLVIVLRLWRMVKIVEEMSVGAEEQMEELEARIEKLEQEKAELEQQLRLLEEGGQ